MIIDAVSIERKLAVSLMLDLVFSKFSQNVYYGVIAFLAKGYLNRL